MAGFFKKSLKLKTTFKVSMIFCVVWALSFNALGEQEGFCVECLIGGQAQGEIQDLSKLTCEAQVSRPECKNVPKILKPDCDRLSKPIEGNNSEGFFGICIPVLASVTIGSLYGMSRIVGRGVSTSGGTRVAVTGLTRFVPWVTGAVVGLGGLLLAVKYHNKVREVRREAKQRGLDPKDTEGIKEVAKQEIAFSIGKRVYKLVYGDGHCYNKVIKTVRVCGLMAGLIGVSLATAVGAASIEVSHLLEYRKVEKEIQDKLQAIEDDTPPSATERVDTLLNEASQ